MIATPHPTTTTTSLADSKKYILAVVVLANDNFSPMIRDILLSFVRSF
jgi:hypothetical protein